MQIADELRQQIIDGTLPPGARFPTLAEIQARFHVAEGTAYQATRVLVNEGLTVTKPGAQTRVRELPEVIRLVRSWYRDSRSGSPWHADLAAQGLIGSQQARMEQIDAPPAIAERLVIRSGEPVIRTEYTYFVEQKPALLCTSYERMDLVPEYEKHPVMTPETGPHRYVEFLDRMAYIGVELTRVVEEIVPRTLTEKEAKALDERAGIACVVIERTFFAGPKPVETADLVLSTLYRASYEIPIGDPPSEAKGGGHKGQEKG